MLRDYPSSLTVPKGRLEISFDYLASLGSYREDEAAAGDLQGLRLLADYGLARRTTLMSAFAYRNIDFGEDTLKIVSADMSLKRNLLQRRYGWIPKIAVDAGLRADIALEDGLSPLEATSAGRFTLDGLEDATTYARLTAGQIWGRFFPHLFLEYGHSNLAGVAEWAAADGGSISSTDLGRSEDYLKFGVSLLIKFPYKALLHLEYDYRKLFRSKDLDEVDDDHILTADFNYYLTPSAVFNMGGKYSAHRQNGRIPFLYQSFSQEEFEEKYTSFQIGLTYLFGGR